MRALFAVLLLLGTSLAAKAPASPPSQLIFTNVNVVDVRSGTVGHGMTVVIRNGRVDAIAKVGLIGSSHEIQVVNANGKYLIPGLWDMHVHSAGGPAGAWDEKIIYPLYVANGVTGIRDMGGDPDALEKRHAEIERGVLVGPRMTMVGPFLNGGTSDAQTVAVNSPAEARTAVAALKKRGVDFIKILSNLSRETYLAIAEECAKEHLRLVGHVPDAVSVAEASAEGQRSMEHLSGMLLACSSQEGVLRQERLEALAKKDGAAYSAAGMKALETYDSNKAHGLFVELTDNNTYQVPTLVWWRANAHLGDANLKEDGRLRFVPAAVRADWEKQASEVSEQQLAYLGKAMTRYREMVRAMHKAGVPFMAGTDGPDPYVYPGFSLHDELELLAACGFSAMEALQAATYYPALFMSKLDQYGVIEKGRVADLVLLDGDPTEDIRNTRKIDAVVIGGRYYSREMLDHMLMQVEELAAK